ncbi:chemotaxis protein CheA [Pseudoroseicyclus tamaricis]|nr:chemotaxis protein CheA [Pseudoroseicyclus tamaricis]
MDAETLAVFRAETEGLVETLEERLLALQATPEDRELIDGVFRDLHTLKGTGAMFGREDIAGFLHDFESAFEAVRSGAAEVDAPLVAISLRARDHVAALLEAEGAPGGEAILADLARHLGKEAGAEEGFALDLGEPPPAAGAGPWQLTFKLPADTLVLGGKPELVLAELRELGATRLRARIRDVPPLPLLDAAELHLGWEVELPAEVSEDAIRDVFLFHEQGLELTLARAEGAPPPAQPAPETSISPAEPAPEGPTAAAQPRPAPAAPPSAAEPRDASAAAPAAKPSAHMRVPAERLDDMMDRVGELVLAEARLVDIVARSGDPSLVAVTEDIQRLTAAMRDTTMSIRMTPISTITGRFRRLVHDLTSKLGKRIAFVAEGEETELDKTVVERLTEPLMHIIRNAADHGLEEPSGRAAAGKEETGTITLSARYSGAEVLISLSDDGRGLNREAIRARATARGLLGEGAEPADEELFGLIFAPGFSTAAEVTELSGRGVGMDVVKRTIDGLRGAIEVTSRPGEGTSVTLRLPLTLAIIDGLLIEVAGERFVLPLAAVDEIVELPEALAEPGARGNAFLDIRDSLVPFLRLRQLLQSSGVPGPHQKVIVVTSADGRVGLVVDRIIGSNQTVIKQLSPLHAGVKTFSGATILGDGAVALILDVPQLVARGRLEADGREAA